MASDTLNTYLNDHLAGSVAGSELAGKLSSEYADTTFGSFLATLAEFEVLPEPPLREQPRLQLRPLRQPVLGPRVAAALG